MSYFAGKVIWITGASSGIGEALAKALAKEQAKLVFSSRNRKELLRVQEECKLGDERCLILPLDLEHMDEPEALVQEVIGKFGRIDVLINNGGVSQRAFAKDTPLETDRRLMEVNYFGPVALTKSVISHMTGNKSGQLVVISSISGKFGFYLRSAYSSAKHALHGFFESLRMESHGDGISVLIVCPGKISTNISVNALTAEGKSFGKMDAGQQEGMPAQTCALQILDAMRTGKEELIIGNFKEKTAVLLKRFFPGLFSRMIRKQKVE